MRTEKDRLFGAGRLPRSYLCAVQINLRRSCSRSDTHLRQSAVSGNNFGNPWNSETVIQGSDPRVFIHNKQDSIRPPTVPLFFKNRVTWARDNSFPDFSGMTT